MREQMVQMAQDVKVATTVGGSTTALTMFDLIQGGISIFALAAGAVLSLSLIIIHWQRWLAEKKEANYRVDLEMQDYLRKIKNYELENETLNLKLKVLQMELKDEA